VTTFRFDPQHSAFAKEAGWQDTFDDLRIRPRKRGERINESTTAPLVCRDPAPDGAMAGTTDR